MLLYVGDNSMCANYREQNTLKVDREYTITNVGVLQWQGGIRDLMIGDSTSVIVIYTPIDIYGRLWAIY